MDLPAHAQVKDSCCLSNMDEGLEVFELQSVNLCNTRESWGCSSKDVIRRCWCRQTVYGGSLITANAKQKSKPLEAMTGSIGHATGRLANSFNSGGTAVVCCCCCCCCCCCLLPLLLLLLLRLLLPLPPCFEQRLLLLCSHRCRCPAMP